MKKTITLLIIVVVTAIMSLGSAFAQPGSYYKKWLHNQSFDGLEALPTGWSNPNNNANDANHATTPASIFARSGGSGLNNNTFRWITTSSGNAFRGADLRFPATPTETRPSGDADFDASKVWHVEFDWNTAAATLSHGNALSMILCGSNSSNVRNSTQWYADAILGIFVMGDKKFHYWNMDLIGYPVPDASGNPTEAFMGPAFSAGEFPRFNRVWNGGGINVDSTYKANKATETAVTFEFNVTYKVKATLNFETQKVDSLTITDVNNPTNSQTIYNMPFLAPSTAAAGCPIPVEERIVKNLSLINVGDPRSTNAGNVGGGSVHTTYIDNLEIYVWKESLGRADVTINYKDREGNAVKTPRIVTQQEVGFIYNLQSEDKADFTDGTYYYFYDATATHTANASKGNGENLTIDFATSPGVDNSLTVVFKKAAVTAGTYVWSGDASGKWNYLDDNFKVAGGAAMAYQPGNEALFSNADAISKTVEVEGNIELNEANMTVSVPDYIFAGTGKILGTGSFHVNAPATLAADNRLVGGAIIQTNQPVTVKNANAAVKYSTAETEISLNLEAGATFNKAIEGAEGSTLNLNLVSLNEYQPAISGFSTINIRQGVQTSLQSATWRTGWGGTLPANAQVNYYNDVVGNPIPNGLGVVHPVMQNAKLHLGPHTRLVRQYNENANNADVTLIGELTGDAGSRIESGFVDGRYFRYDIGGLGTDAVFNGELGAFTRSHVAATDTTAAVTTYAANGVGVTKSGAGTWTVNGNFNFPKGTRGSQLNVSGGKFIVNGNVLFPNESAEGSQMNVTGQGTMDVNGKVTFVSGVAAHAIKVTDGTLQFRDSVVAPALNQIALTVEAAGTLKTGNNFIGASSVIVNGTIEGGGTFANTFSLTSEFSTLKLKVNSFEEGDYEHVDALGDISIKSGIVDISVTGPVHGSKQITILKAGGNYDILDNIAFVQVLVNGKNITGNTADTEVPENGEIYYFDPETGVLGHIGTSGINDVNANKEIKSIEYFNIMGQKVTKYHDGYILKRTTYTDNSVDTFKYLNKERSFDRQ
jgi:hypothetical protein